MPREHSGLVSQPQHKGHPMNSPLGYEFLFGLACGILLPPALLAVGVTVFVGKIFFCTADPHLNEKDA